MSDELSKGEIRKDAIQDGVTAAAATVGAVTTILTNAVGDVARTLGGFATEVFEIRDSTRRALKDQELARSGSAEPEAQPKDDDEAEKEAVKPKTSKGLFAARALGKAGLGKGKPITGGYNMMSDEGFTFSPLKKDRRAAGAGASFLK